MNNDLSNGYWEQLTFAEAVEPISDEGKRVDQRDYQPTGALPVIDQGEDFVGGYTNDLSKAYTGPLPVIVFGDHTRRVKLVHERFAVGAQGVKLLRPREGWSAKYFAYLLPTLPIPDRGYSRHYQFVRKLTFRRPPLDEQQRIVAEIEKQFTRLEAGVSLLKRLQAALKRYRASVLKVACEGGLVPTEAELARNENRTYETGEQLLQRILKERRENWNGKGKYKEPGPARASHLPALPDGWVWAGVEQISTKVVDGVHKKPNYVPSGIPFITVRNLTAGSGISFEKIKYVTAEDHKEFVKRADPQRGDILVSKDGTLGTIRVINTDVPFSIFVSVAMIKPVIRPMSSYLGIALSSPQVQIQMVPKGSGLQHIHLEDLREDCIPLPPRDEQVRVVEEVERRLSVVAELEDMLATNEKRAAHLRQAILQQAFASQRK